MQLRWGSAPRSRRFLVWPALALLTIPFSAGAQDALVVEDAAVLPKDLTKELAKGKLLDQIDRGHKYAKTAYTPPASMLAPFAAAQVGAPVAAQLVQGTELAVAPAAQALCQSIVNDLLAEWHGPKPAVTVVITAEAGYHGLAVPSGLMLVGIGTFNTDIKKGAITIEDLALLLGHELSHILLHHLDSDKAVNGIAKALALAANSYMTYAQVNKTRFIGNQMQLAGDAHLYRQGLVAGVATQSVINDLLAPSFGRNRELEADRLGFDLAHRAHYAVTEQTAIDFLDHHKPDDALFTRRLAALTVILHALSAEAVSRAKMPGGQFADLARKLAGAASDAALGGTMKVIAANNKNHPDPAQRKAFLLKYIQANYHADDPAAPVAQLPRVDPRLSMAAETPQIAQLVAHVGAADAVQKNIVDLAAQPDAAADDAPFRQMMTKAGLAANMTVPTAVVPTAAKGRKGRKPAAAPKPPTPAAGFADNNAAFTWRMQGILLAANGNAAAAQEAWRQGSRSDFVSLDAVQRWTRSLTPDQLKTDLPPAIDRIGKLLGTTDPVLDLVVASAIAGGDVATAETTAARCVTYDDGALYPDCVLALGYDPLNKATPAQTEAGKAAFSNKSLEKNFLWVKHLTDLF